MASGIVLMIMTMSMLDATEHSIGYYFESVRDYDVDVAFDAPVSESVVHQVRKWPGVQWAEGNVGLPVQITHDGTTDDFTITGVPAGSRLQQFEDERGRPVTLWGHGLYPAKSTARTLGIERGDVLKLEYAYNSRDVRLVRPVHVTRTVRQPLGAGLYMDADALRQRFGSRLGFPPGSISGMVIKAAPGHQQAVAARAYDLPSATMVETTYDIRKEIDQGMAMTYIFIGVLMLFAGALTVAIVYNTINSNVHERRSEIASLRALGVRMAEVRRMITIENLASTLLGILVGVPLGIAGARGMIEMWESEMISISFYVAPRTYAISVIFTLVLVLACELPAFRNLADMNLAQMTRLHGE